MSEYQRYEFMTRDRPLTRAELEAVNMLSSHIDASSTHALIEYHWGDFKHNPLTVLHKFFDGFLYWANWGAPRLALRFPQGVLPADLLDDYDLEEVVILTRHPDYDILDLHFGELEGPDEWVDYELGALIAIRDELMEGDLRALYITWLAGMRMLGSYDEEEDDDIIRVPAVPPAFGTLTAAQQALAELWQVPQELLVAAARHSSTACPSPVDDVVAWVEVLPQARRTEYLVRLAKNEPGLSRRLVKELRALGQGNTSATSPPGEHVTYAKLLAESKAIKAAWEREQREQEELARQRHMQHVHEHQDEYWQRVERAVTRASGTGYDEAAGVLSELREVADHFQETQQFQARFRTWVHPHLRRPAFIKRLQERQFPLPEA
jgi:hypothetical protein